ncbi:MAG: hypothetical protein JST00_40340 [Deltaproteobacteria bacterium]|nr:hypothetical protein [Deltaproteobacteria bacterium]
MRHRVFLGVGIVSVSVACSIGCSGILGFDDFKVNGATPEEASTPTDGGVTDATSDGDADPAFACANLPPPNPDPSKQVEISMRYVDYSTGKPPQLTIARLCAATDPNCGNARESLTGASPADAGPEGGTGWVVPNAEGVVTAKVEYGFEGFFEAKSSLYPPTFKATSPPLRNPKTEMDQLLLRPGEINFLADQLLNKANAYDSVGHGLVFLFARDCNNQPLAGVSFTTTATDPLLQLFYVINTAPSITDTKTDALGRAGYLNMPPGIHTFTGFIGDGANKRKYGSGRVFVRAGASTTLTITPSP